MADRFGGERAMAKRRRELVQRSREDRGKNMIYEPRKCNQGERDGREKD